MRAILFRGKQENTNEWVYGYLSKSRNAAGKLQICIDYEESGVMCSSLVFCDTVGQYTGLTDKNGTKIFEGDILKYVNEDEEVRYITVVFDDCAFLIDDSSVVDCDLLPSYICLGIEVSGNIYDNPELLAGERGEKP